MVIAAVRSCAGRMDDGSYEALRVGVTITARLTTSQSSLALPASLTGLRRKWNEVRGLWGWGFGTG